MVPGQFSKFKFSLLPGPTLPRGPTGPNIDTFVPEVPFLLTVYLYSLKITTFLILLLIVFEFEVVAELNI